MKKSLSIIMAFVMLLGMFTTSPTAHAGTEGSVNGVFNAILPVLSETSRQVTLVKQGDTNLGPSFKGNESGAILHRLNYAISVVKDGGEGTVGYCIEPFARGTIPNGEPQTLNSIPYTELDDLDKQLIGIMMAGYPTKTHGKTAAEAYMATQIAVQHFVFQYPDKYPNPKGVKFNDDSWARWENTAIISVAKAIYEEGINNPYSPDMASVGVEIEASNEGKFLENGDNLELTLTISIDGEFTKGKLTFDSAIKNMLKSNTNCTITVGSRTASFEVGLLGTDDFEEGIKVLPGETTVKIVLDKKAAESYMDIDYSGDAKNGSYSASKDVGFTFAVVGGSAKQAYKGTNNNPKNQDYIYVAPGETAPIQQSLFMATADEWQFFGETGSGGLKITKYNKKTNQLVSGAIFEIRGVSDGNRDFLVHIQASPGATLPPLNGGTAITGVGTIELQNIPAGEYQITEITPPPNFDYCDFGINSQVVTVTEGADSGLYPQVRFENNPFATLKIKKVDALTGNPVNGAILRVRNALTGLDVELTTMNGGIIELKNLPEGNYEISEVYAPEGYVLSDEKKTATLRWGETTDITYENEPKTELLVKKIDADSGAVLDGAVFKLTKPDSGSVWEDTTFYDGYAVFSDIPAGTYVLEETKAPQGYLLDTTPRTIVIENHKINEVVVQNRMRPKLRILKIDVITGEPLPLAEFRVTKVEAQTVSEYITDFTGEILIENLDEAIYRAEEFMAPDGYIRYDVSKEIALEWGKTKTLKFDNIRKPTLIITKTNALTYQPIPDTTYKIEYEAQGGGVVSLGTFRTNANGQIVIPKAEAGWYIITETLPAPGFSPAANPITRKYLAPGENAYTNFEVGGTGGDVSGDNILVTYGEDYLMGEEIINYPLNSIVIRKVNAITGGLLPGAVFEVRQVSEDISGTSGTLVGRYTTGSSGTIVITGLKPGGYIIEEVQAPTDYMLSENSMQQAWLKPDGTSIVETTFANYPYGGILITKVDAKTNAPLPNAKFRVTDSSGAVVGNTNGVYTTGSNGEVQIPDVKPGAYVITEIEAPEYYVADTTPQTVHVGTDGKVYKVSFQNQPSGTLVITKKDAVSNVPLSGAEFFVTKSDGSVVGGGNGYYTTDATGTITIPYLEKGAYIVRETKAPTDYILENQTKTIDIDYGKTYNLEFFNRHMSGLQIIKIDKQTKQPIKGAEFAVYKQSGEMIGRYTTDANGVIIIDTLETGWYKAVETKATDGYILDDTPQDFQITANQFIKLVFENAPLSGLVIRKVDADTRDPLEGAEFTVRTIGGLMIGIYRSGTDGLASVGTLEPGWYQVTETKAPDGYTLGDNVQTVEIKHTQMVVIEFQNRAFGSLVVKKIDEVTGSPLAGATFEVQKQGGGFVGEYTTGVDGTVNIPSLAPGWYVVSETKAPQGYIMDSTAKTVEVKPVVPSVVTFTNKPLSGLKIIKLDSATRQPIAGVEFAVTKMSGEKLTNEFSANTFKTDSTGQIYIPGLEDGYYIVTETRSADGYILDGEPKTVLIQSGKSTVLEVLNTPMSGLLIVKTDEATGKPLEGVVFDVTRADGQRVSGLSLDGNQPNTEANSPNKTTSPNGDITGSYTTDTNGRILINTLLAGEYHVTERQALAGYELDTDVHAATVTPGKLTTLQLTNKQKAGLRLVKIDSVTKRPIYNVEFMIFDANNKVVGTFYTDNNGVIDFTGILTEGRYTIRETRAASGYYLDEIPKTVEFVSNKVTEIVWTNVPKMAQIQILKKSGDDNEVNGLPAGSPLTGATFEAYDYKTGNLIDRFVSGNDGRAVSAPLPLGRYIIKEVQAPKWYKLSDKTLDVELEFATQIVKLEYLNYSANTGVTMRKTGVAECMPGDTISYTIKEVRNTGTTPLTDFYWRDTLPTDAVRLTKIVTGTYNQALKYKVMITTNKGDTRIIADNLSTTKNNVIDCSNAALGLKNDEYVTSFTLIFGTVKAGFAQVEQPQIFVKVLATLPNGYEFANKVDVGGKYGSEWVVGNAVAVSRVYAKPVKLPRTGY